MRLGTPPLLAASCGTAIAAVCAVGLLSIEHLASGIWSALAVACGGIICFCLARRFARLAAVLPSSAGILAYLSRGLGRRSGLLLTMPYLLLGLFVVGGEATVIGLLLSRALGLPWLLGALLFLVGTWALCRRGLQLSLRAETVATWALIIGLFALSIYAIIGAAVAGRLSSALFTAPPSLARFVAAVGQAIFLFMGFELITSQADLARPRALSRALGGSVIVLALFYATLSLGLSSLGASSQSLRSGVIPQLAIAESAGGRGAVLLIALLSLLASYTSFNGALIALSRLTAALAAQGSLPRSLAQLDRNTHLPQSALLVLLVFCIASTLIIGCFDLLLPAILTTAIAAALAYAAVAWVRERAPFCEPQRRSWQRFCGHCLTAFLFSLAIGVLFDTSSAPVRTTSLFLLGITYAATLGLIVRPFAAARSSTWPSR